MNHLIGE